MEFEAGPEKVVCTHTCKTDIFFFQMVHCCYISQVIYKRWQWDDNPVLCRLHSPLQVNYSPGENPRMEKTSCIISGSVHNCVVFLYLGNRHRPLSCCWICSYCSFCEVVNMLGVGCLIWMFDLDVWCWMLIWMLDVG